MGAYAIRRNGLMPNLFNDIQSERYFENRYKYIYDICYNNQTTPAITAAIYKFGGTFIII
jgi:hypothetical protein